MRSSCLRSWAARSSRRYLPRQGTVSYTHLEEGAIVVLGTDTDAAYYGLATLEQMLDQTEDGQLKISTFEDYAFQKYRGCVEGYYGYPWSVEGTLSWFDFAKKYKMNVFLYGPKNDPYHLGQWDEDYPTEVTEEESELGVRTQDEMRQIAEKAAPVSYTHLCIYPKKRCVCCWRAAATTNLIPSSYPATTTAPRGTADCMIRGV